jgi:hypothetical protein
MARPNVAWASMAPKTGTNNRLCRLIGTRIREARCAKGISIIQLSAACEIATDRLNMMEGRAATSNRSPMNSGTSASSLSSPSATSSQVMSNADHPRQRRPSTSVGLTSRPYCLHADRAKVLP